MPHFEGCSFKPELPEGRDLGKERVLLHCCCAPCSTAILEWMVEEGLRPGIFFSNSNIVPFDEYVKRRDELVRFAAAYGLPVVDDGYDHASWLDFVREGCRSQATGPLQASSSSHISGPLQTSGPWPARTPKQATPDDSASCSRTRKPVEDLLKEPERGPRCLECFKYRLLRAARYAVSHGYTLLATTLASSRWKDLAQVDSAGRWAVKQASSSGDPTEMGGGAEMDGTPAATQPLPIGREGTFGLAWWSQNWRKGGLQARRQDLIKACDLYNQTWCGCEFSLRPNPQASTF